MCVGWKYLDNLNVRVKLDYKIMKKIWSKLKEILRLKIKMKKFI